MDGNSDTVPVGTAIWIRKLSGSPGLGAYRYGDVDPKEWEPIFGTAGSTNALEWDQVMFHPCFTAPPGTQAYTATFEAFLMDTATGTPLPGGSTGPFVLDWTNIAGWPPNVMRRPELRHLLAGDNYYELRPRGGGQSVRLELDHGHQYPRRAERPVGGRRGTQRGPQVLPHAAWDHDELPAIAVRPMPASTRATRSGDLPLRAGHARRFHAH